MGGNGFNPQQAFNPMMANAFNPMMMGGNQMQGAGIDPNMIANMM